MKRWEIIALTIIGVFLVLQLCLVVVIIVKGPGG